MRHRFLVAAVLLLHVTLLAWSASRHSPTYDETAHLVAGLSHLDTGRHDMYCVNPPLVRLVAAIPVWFSDPVFDWSAWRADPAARSEFEVGRQFVSANGRESEYLFTIARWACIPFSLLGALGCYLFARDLYGTQAALAALSLWCLSPNILGHAALLTPDAAAAALGILNAYVFWKWLEDFSWSAAYMAGVMLGLVLATKSTWVILFGLWPLITCVVLLHRDHNGSGIRLWRPATAGMVTILAVSVFVLNVVYEFDGSGRPLGDEVFVSRALAGDNEMGNRFHGTLLGWIPVPFPRDFVRGIDIQKHDIDKVKPSYLRGTVRKGGWWYYYLYGMAVKMPIGTLVLIAFASIGLMRAATKSDVALGETLLITIAITLIALVSSQTQMNKHIRYVLPAFPFLFVLCARLFRHDATRASRYAQVTKYVATVAVLAVAVSSLRVCPHSLSYFNEVAGGPKNGGFHLLSSNIAWGQDLIGLREWLDEHPEVDKLGLAVHCNFDPRALGIEFSLPPAGGAAALEHSTLRSPTRWYAVDANMLYAYPYMIPDGRGKRFRAYSGEFQWFQQFTPVARAGYSINIYDLSHDDLRKAGFDVEPGPSGNL